MSRNSLFIKTIAVLATGDEICHGDIINSNSQEIAYRLSNEGMQVRMHVVAPDNITEIEDAMAFLLKNHQAIIITGGLGPTSDDLTRFALSKTVNQPLQFDNTTWEYICTRLRNFGYDVPPESNRQQALFPEGAVIIPNPNGTAAGCYIKNNAFTIFMLPGPPSECLPMIDKVVIPILKENNFQQMLYKQNWFLFGVSEGKIAEELDTLAKPYNCITGYRLCYPYIEFKLQSNNKDDFITLLPLIKKTVKPYVIEDGQQLASIMLQKRLIELPVQLQIQDSATGGLLESTISSPLLRNHILFNKNESIEDSINIKISGLEDFWEQRKITKTSLEIIFEEKNGNQKIDAEIPFRGSRVKLYAVEFICQQILLFLKGK